ncbi:MAG: hypothetical protein IKB16_03725 [Lentisphaeria bacterium]|nr:hypothetical protein [Lentisphaeria bacterium]
MMVLKKQIFAILFLLVGMVSLFAEIRVERVNINRNFPRLIRNSTTDFQCIVTNTDNRQHLVEVRFIPLAGDTMNTYNSGKILLPPKTTGTLSFPIQTSLAEGYTIEVRSDGVRIPRNGVVNDIKLMLNSYSQRTAVILNDGEESPGLPARGTAFKDKLFFNTVPAARAPVNANDYSECPAVMLYKPALKQYSAEQFRALLSYVAGGGTLIVLHPDTVQKMASTPLAELLPVIPIKKHTVAALPPVTDKITGFDRSKRWEIEILETAERGRGVNLMFWNTLPLLRVSQYGLGYVKVAMFPVNEQTFCGSNNAGFEKFLFELLTIQQLYPNRKSFETVLDKLTGFAIPDTSEIVVRVTIYLVVFFLILLAGLFFKRSGLAWTAAVLAALGATGLTLMHSASKFAAQESVLSEIRLEQASPVNLGEVYCSCFAKEESVIHAGMPSEICASFSALPESPYISNYFVNLASDVFDDTTAPQKPKPRQVRYSFPVEVHRDIRGKKRVEAMHIAPRTSRQFMAFYTAANRDDRALNVPEAELYLTEQGLSMAAYPIPDQYRKMDLQGAYLVMPGGVRKLSVDNGACSLESDSSFFLNEMDQALMDSVCNGLRKPFPYVALVYPVKKNMVELNMKIQPQGREIIMIPARVTINSRKVTIPKEMLVLSSNNAMSRTFLHGNEIIGKSSLMVGQPLTFGVSLPAFLNGIFPPEKVKLVMDYSIADNVSMNVSLSSTDKKEIPGRSTGTMEYEFTGADMAKTLNKENCLELNIKPRMEINEASMSIEQSLRAKFWNLRAADLEITGSIRSDLPLPLRF